MPIGVIINVCSVILGGLTGSLLGSRLSDSFKQNMNLVISGCAMTIGISAITLMENMPAVILATVVGSAIGLLLHLGDAINSGAKQMQRAMGRLMHTEETADEAAAAGLVTAIVLFCASGTGIYGTILSGMTGDHSVLIAKSVLDFVTAMIFACTLGRVVSAIAVPQLAVFLVLYFLAGWIGRAANPGMMNDFKACGGVIMVVTGLRIAGLKMYPVADMLPAMVLVMPVSWLWQTQIAPAVAALAQLLG